MRYLPRFYVFLIVFLVLAENPFRADPYCILRLFGDNVNQRRFFFTDTCDMEPLAKPYKNFPPSLYLMGTQKGGTTALWHMIEFNTVIKTGGYRKESNFLAYRHEHFKRKYKYSKESAYLWYSNTMSSVEGHPTMDASPGYSKYASFFIQNLKYTTDFKLEEMPKMLYILRNPLIRAYSHFNMRLRWMSGIGPKDYIGLPKEITLAAALERDMFKLRSCGMDVFLNDTEIDPRKFYNQDLLSCFHHHHNNRRPTTILFQGMYSWHLESIRHLGNPNRIVVACFRDLEADNYGFLRATANFVGVPIEGNRKCEPSHERREDCPMAYRKRTNLTVDPKVEAMLLRFYNKWNEVLKEDFGIDCGWNSKLIC